MYNSDKNKNRMFQSNQKTVFSIFEYSFNKTFDSNTSFIQKLCDKTSSLRSEFYKF